MSYTRSLAAGPATQPKAAVVKIEAGRDVNDTRSAYSCRVLDIKERKTPRLEGRLINGQTPPVFNSRTAKRESRKIEGGGEETLRTFFHGSRLVKGKERRSADRTRGLSRFTQPCLPDNSSKVPRTFALDTPRPYGGCGLTRRRVLQPNWRRHHQKKKKKKKKEIGSCSSPRRWEPARNRGGAG